MPESNMPSPAVRAPAAHASALPRPRPSLSGWQLVSLLAVFLVSAAVTSVASDGYLTLFTRIARCPAVPPQPNLALMRCEGLGSEYYYSGAMYLDINKELVASLRAADVVIIGNSRTQKTFASRAIEEYFSRKGLRYFVLSSDGSGFRYIQLILERLAVKPRIFMINNESFYVDILDDFNKDIVLTPERFALEMRVFYLADKFHRWVCAGAGAVLSGLYCGGRNMAIWRRIDNGALLYDISNYKNPDARIPVEIPPETRLHYLDRFTRNARTFLASPSVEGACIITYVIPSNSSSVDLARAMAQALGAPFIFPKVDNLFTFDTSHLVPESSERWSAAYIADVDRHLDACLRRR